MSKEEKIYKCKSCKETVEKNAKVCPHCGAKNPTITTAQNIFAAIFLVALFSIIIASCSDKKEPNTDTSSTTIQSETHWYDGGNLFNKNGLDWQEASYENKLATAGNIYAYLYKEGKLSHKISSKISTVDDFKPLAEDLVSSLDKAFEKKPTQRENEVLYTNQTVSATSVILLTLQGSLK